MDRPFATPTYHLCLKKADRERELPPASFHQSHQRPQTVISGTRRDELLQRLGGRLPLNHEVGDGANTHGR